MTVPTTCVPDAVDALLSVAETLRANGVVDRVLDGPQPVAPNGDPGLVLAVFVGDDAAVADRTPVGMTRRYDEDIDVACSLTSWSGGESAKPHRDAIKTALAALRDELDADPTLGGTVASASLGQSDGWSSDSDPQGTAVSLGFTVHVKALV